MNTTDWLERAREVVNEIRTLMRPFGVEIHPEVRVEAEPHPIPGYVHDELLISFCPPVVERSADRLRWLYFGPLMGCASLEQAVEFYELALPFVIAHELAHHVRFSRSLASDSPFVEEQVCDVIATAWLEALPRYRPLLEPLQARCRVMREALEQNMDDEDEAPLAFLPDLGAELTRSSHLDRSAAASLRALARESGVPLEELLGAHPAADSGVLERAALREARVRGRLESRYTEDPGEYWYLSLTWVESYLSMARPLTLAQVVREHLAPGEDSTRSRREVADALRQVLLSPRAGLPPKHGGPEIVAGLRGAAAGGLIEILGASAIEELARFISTRRDGPARVAVARALRSGWSADGLAPDQLWSAPLDDQVHAALALELLRLAARCGVKPPRAPWLAWLAAQPRETTLLGTMRAELMAASILEPQPELLDEVLQGPHGPKVAESWLRQRGSLAELPVAGHQLWPRATADLREPLAEQLPPEEIIHDLPPRGAPGWIESLEALEKLLATKPWPALPDSLWAAAARRDLRGDAGPLEALSRQRITSAAGHLERAEAAEGPRAELATTQLCLDARRYAGELVRAWAPTSRLDIIHRVLEREAWTRTTHPDSEAILGAALPAALRAPVLALLRGDASGGDVADSVDAALTPLVQVGLGLEEDPAMLSKAERVVQLRRTSLFAGVEPERLWEVAEQCVERSLQCGEVLFAEGDPGEELFLVTAGELTVERTDAKGEAQAVATVGPGAVLGEMAIFEAAPRSAGARALTDCRVLGLGGEAIARVGREHPEVYEAFLRALSSRLRQTTDRLVSDP